MTRKKILLKAFAKAVDNGFKLEDIVAEYYCYEPKLEMDSLPVASIIFSHDFAKAFWKDSGYCNDKMKIVDPCGEPWEYHLMHMVLKEDPIKYLKKFL